jgi:hypothetical protein
MKTIVNSWQYLFSGLYTWVVSLFFGAILLDVVYSRLAFRTLQPSETTGVFSEAADFLLLIGAFTVLTALGAIGSSWNLGSARYLFIASTLFILGEFLVPPLFSSMFESMGVNLGINFGPFVRLVGSALASILAFAGLSQLYISKS